AGVPWACGPSSNVSATPSPFAGRSRTPKSGRSLGTPTTTDGNQYARRPAAAVGTRGIWWRRPMLLLGVGAALAAAGFYSAGVSLQALEARRTPDRHFLRLSLLRVLATRRVWLAGIALDACGWALQTVALGLAP